MDDLIERVAGLTGPDREVDDWIDRLMNGWTGPALPTVLPSTPHLTGSLDAAVALCERMLPGWHWCAQRRADTAIAYVNNGEPHFVGMTASPNPDRRWFEVRHKTPAIALVLALLSALRDRSAP